MRELDNRVSACGESDSTDDSLLSVPALAERSGVTLRMLDYWIRRGWIRPLERDFGDGNGIGFPRRVPADEVAKTLEVARLVRAGIPPELAFSRIGSGDEEIGPGIRLVLDSVEPPEDVGEVLTDDVSVH